MKLFIRWMKNRGIALYHIYKCTDQSFCSEESSGASGGVHYGPAVHAVIVPAVAVRGLQAGFGRHQSPGHRAAVTSVLHHRLQLVVLRLRHEVVDGEWVVEGVVGVVGVRFQVRGLVQQQRVRVVREQVLRVCERGGHAHGA